MSDHSKRMPIWARALIVATAFSIVSGAAVAVLVALGVNKFVKDTFNKNNIQKVVASIADFQPLPPSFVWLMATSQTILSETTSFATAEHSPEKTRLMIFRMSPENRKKYSDPDRLVAVLAANGFAKTSMTLRDRGELTVAGEKMKYATGELVGTPGRMTGFTGVIYPSKNDKVIVLFGGTPGATFNMDATTEFLSAIKSF